MAKIGDQHQTADWKSEKHVPLIDCPDEVKAGEMFDATVTLGKEVAHPNTAEHHIRWIQRYFKPDGDRFTYQVGNYVFSAHGGSVEGADKGPVHTNHSATTTSKTISSGLKKKLAGPGCLLNRLNSMSGSPRFRSRWLNWKPEISVRKKEDSI